LGVGLFGLDLLIGYRKFYQLKDEPPASVPSLPTLSIVVAARNEEKKIGAAVQSMLLQDYPGCEVVVVNDRSTDQTKAILTNLQKTHPALTVISVESLPKGWLGKNHALQKGAEASRGSLILFTDADVEFESQALRRSVHYFLRKNLDHLAALPDLIAPTFLLKVSVAGFLFGFGAFLRMWKVEDPKSSVSIGIGAFNLIRKSTYEALGKHERIRLCVVDDLKLGALVKGAGFRQGLILAHQLIAVEWYSTFREYVDGVMKNMFAAHDFRVWRTVGVTVVFSWITIAPFVALLCTTGLLWNLNLAISCLLVALSAFNLRCLHFPVLFAFTFPLGALILVWLVLRSTYLTLRNGGIRWRDTFYSLDELRQAAQSLVVKSDTTKKPESGNHTQN
jgi:GT2 family glycosyltransferase